MKKIHARKSKIHGTGLFLDEKALKGSLISHIQGSLSSVKKKLLHTPEEALMHPDWVGISMSKWIDPAVPFKFLNHSCDPSCGVRGKVSIYALRDLEAGEEISIDYSTVEVNSHWQMKCFCNSKKCRGIIRSVEYLPKATFKKYYPFIPTVFKNFYIKKNLKIEDNIWLKDFKKII